MATPLAEVGGQLGLTAERIKQIVKEQGWDMIRDPNGYIKLPVATIRKLLRNRGRRFRPTEATIGLIKGGVGKSLCTINTALAASHRGAVCIVYDLDPESCSTQYLLDPQKTDIRTCPTILEIVRDGVPVREAVVDTRFDGVKLIPCRSRSRRVDSLLLNENPATLMRRQIEELRQTEEVDLVLWDCPPNFCGSVESAYLASSVVVCVTNSDLWSLESLELTIEDLRGSSAKWRCPMPELAVLRNKVAPPQRRDSREIAEELAKDYANLLLDIVIKQSALLSNAINDGTSIFEMRGTTEHRAAFLQLFDYLCPLEQVAAAEDEGGMPVVSPQMRRKTRRADDASDSHT